MKRFFVLLLLLGTSLQFNPLFSQRQDVLKIYLDADRSGTKASGISIERGIRLALSEIDYQIDGRKIELVIRDHHGSSRRSLLHLEEFMQDPEGLAVFCGLHSPPVLANMSFIQNNDILLMDPWAAAGPITRSPGEDGDNWIFRLSIDDTKAGALITSHAIEHEGFRKVVLLLEDTGWGASNKRTMTKALSEFDLEPLDVILFDWNIRELGAKKILEDIHSLDADVILFVANAPEGKTFFKAMAQREEEERIPIRSHWGITGGDLFEAMGAKLLTEEIDLQFIQTSYSFMSPNQSEFAQDVFRRTADLYSDISTRGDIKAPTGFIHGYDLMKILIRAIDEVKIGDDMIANRDAIRNALENLHTPVEGLIKTYNHPFQSYSDTNRDAHEALGANEFIMAQYDAAGNITLLKDFE